MYGNNKISYLDCTAVKIRSFCSILKIILVVLALKASLLRSIYLIIQNIMLSVTMKALILRQTSRTDGIKLIRLKAIWQRANVEYKFAE